MYHRGWKNWGDHPVIVAIFLIGTLITVYTFLTGRTNICDFINIGQNCAWNGTIKLRYSQEKFANLRSQPIVASNVLRQLPEGTPLKVIKPISGGDYKLDKDHQGNDWYEVNVNGQRGYIIIDFVDLDD